MSSEHQRSPVVIDARFGWATGIVYVAALFAESVIAVGIGLTHNESATSIATGLHAHEQRLIAIACLSVIHAVSFRMYLSMPYHLLRGNPDRAWAE
jgi:hypothetical protein